MATTTAPVWRGCRLAARNARFWHGAHDFASTTLCGMPLAGAGMSESHVTAAMREHPACAQTARNEQENNHARNRPAGTPPA